MQQALNRGSHTGRRLGRYTIGSDYHHDDQCAVTGSWWLCLCRSCVVARRNLSDAGSHVTEYRQRSSSSDVARYCFELRHHPAERVGVDIAVRARPSPAGGKTALLTIAVYLVGCPSWLASPALVSLSSSSPQPRLLRSRIFRTWPPCGSARRRTPRRCASEHAATVFTTGLFIAAFVSIPIVNLATPLFGMTFMVRLCTSD